MSREFEIAELFQVEYIGEKRWCAVIKLHLDSIGYYHNGYVQLKDNEFKSDLVEDTSMLTEEITFSGEADFLKALIKGILMYGFDTIHVCDTPETQSFEDVRRRTVILAHEMIDERI